VFISTAPGAFKRAREYKNLTLQEGASRLGILPAELAALENGSRKTTLTQLETIARRYRLSLNFFFLETSSPRRRYRSYRTLGGQTPVLSFETTSALDMVEQLQENLKEIVEQSDIDRLIQALPLAKRSESPETLARRERLRLGVSATVQLQLKTFAKAFQYWRLRIERFGISVFLRKMAETDCRGISLFEPGEFPAIVVNDEEVYSAKIFTLLHEYAHILLRQPGISDEQPGNPTERFCNQFAAGVLMPRTLLNQVLAIREPYSTRDWTDRTIASAAEDLKVSQIALAYRLEELELARPGFAQRFNFGKPSIKRKGGSYVSPAIRRLREVGTHYANRVLKAFNRREIDTTTAARMLNIRPTYFSAMQKEMALARRL
jgi:Zn-dependent peptidase ImmA (M78 family)/transcriptional regulator with XRE-family HTH domain